MKYRIILSVVAVLILLGLFVIQQESSAPAPRKATTTYNSGSNKLEDAMKGQKF